MPCTKVNDTFECDDLTDVWEMIFNPIEGRNYTGFKTPTLQDLERIIPGNVVKISRGINKIFIVIETNDPCYFKLCGKIALGDLENQPFQIGDNICFLYRNVYSISEDLRYI
jgi:hypothetical protein